MCCRHVLRLCSLPFLLAGPADADPLEAWDDLARVRSAVEYTLASQLPNGLFRYDFDFLAAEPSGDDNLVRQAGTLFGLGEYLLETGDARMAPPLARGIERLWAQSLPTGKGNVQTLLEQLGLFSVPSWRLGRALDRWGLLHDPRGAARLVAASERYETAASGATALALIAELAYVRATRENRFAEARAAWLRGLLSLLAPGRGVRAHPVTLEESTYFNGETWLALASYHETFPGDAGAAAALHALEDHLIDRYTRVRETEFYHWGAMASAVRHRTSGDSRFARFVAEQTAWILDERPPEKTRDNQTCSMVEGLASAVSVLAAEGAHAEVLGRARQRVAAELVHNRALQVRAGQDQLALGGGGLLLAPSMREHAGAFLAGRYAPFARTDLNQHCISAFLKALHAGLGSGSIPLGTSPPS